MAVYYAHFCAHSIDETDVPRSVTQRTVFHAESANIPFQDNLPKEIWGLIFTTASKASSDPREIEIVCKYWHDSMRYTIPEDGAPSKDTAGISYTSKKSNPFMEDCMRRY